ncbi:MAG: hypothetical protein ABSF67_03545 [Roseiarcus sp.]|jgi:hypothetical protein
MTRIIRLLAPDSDEANADGQLFKKHDDGCFYVPEEYVGPLLHTGGFSLAADPVAHAAPVAEPQATTLGDIEALARKLPTGDLKALLLGAIASVAQTVPRQTVKVRPPVGTTGFSHGGEHFEVGDDGLIDAPIETLDSICDGPAGFAVVADDPPPALLADDETPADDEVQADDAEPASTDSDVAPLEVEIAAATPIAPMLPRLTIPNLAASSLGRVSGD